MSHTNRGNIIGTITMNNTRKLLMLLIRSAIASTRMG